MSKRATRLGALALAGLLGSVATAASAARLTVDVVGITAAAGDVRVALFADAATFERRDALHARSLPAVVPGLAVTFDEVPPGNYAVLVYHDVDGDGELARGAFGVPTEPWTGSTHGSRFRVPSWEAYVVAVPADGLALELEL